MSFHEKTTFLFSLLISLFVPTFAIAEVPFHSPKDIANGTVSGISSMDAGDIDGDGFLDVLAVEGGKHAGGRQTFAWFKAPNDIQGEWQRYEINPNASLRSFLGSAKLADMDNDGDMDIVSGVPWKEKGVFVYYNNGKGQFEKTQTVIKGKGLYSGVLADLDGDGDIDIVAQDTYANTSKPWIYENRLHD